MADSLYGTPAPTSSVSSPASASGSLYDTPIQEESEGFGSYAIPLGLGAAAAGALLLRKPAVPIITNWIKNVTSSVKGRLPKEYPLLRAIPDSPVVSLSEKNSVNYAESMGKIVTKTLDPIIGKKIQPDEWVTAEQNAYNTYKQLLASGVDNATAKLKSLDAFPPAMKDALLFIENKVVPIEDWAASFFGHPPLPRVEYGYLPRVAKHNVDNMVKIGEFLPGLRSDIRSSLGMFEKERAFPTMFQGIAHGEEYVDPSLAILYRTQAGMKLAATAQYVHDLEKGGVLFRSLTEAQAASRAGDAIAVKGIPGAKQWFARSKLEAQFIKDQLENPHVGGSIAQLSHKANALLRNPNLFNPFPHFLKNMLFKYGWSGGSMRKVFGDVQEYIQGADPQLIQRFQAVMPFHTSGKTAGELVMDAVAKAKGSRWREFTNVITKPQQFSSELVFGKFDPWLRYSRWKQYVQGGMKDQEAANHVWLDLIRYGTRSELVDFWKSIPLNFFVPWRVGTITSLVKNMRSDPMKAAMFLGSVDTMREVLYRKTGWWFHTPSDYIEAPVVRLLEGVTGGAKKGGSAAASIASTTALFGPGGDGADRLIRNVLQTMDEGSTDWKRFTNMFWGVAQIFDPYGHLTHEVTNFAKTGNPRHLVNVLQTVALGAHDAVGYRPRRFGQLIPENVISKSPRVVQAEFLQERAQARRDKPHRPYKTIKERVGED